MGSWRLCIKKSCINIWGVTFIMVFDLDSWILDKTLRNSFWIMLINAHLVFSCFPLIVNPIESINNQSTTLGPISSPQLDKVK